MASGRTLPHVLTDSFIAMCFHQPAVLQLWNALLAMAPTHSDATASSSSSVFAEHDEDDEDEAGGAAGAADADGTADAAGAGRSQEWQRSWLHRVAVANVFAAKGGEEGDKFVARLRAQEAAYHADYHEAEGTIGTRRLSSGANGKSAANSATEPVLYRDLFVELAAHGAISLALYRASQAPARNAGMPYVVVQPDLNAALDCHGYVFYLQPEPVYQN